MTIKQTLPHVSQGNIAASQIHQFFANLKRIQFNGKVELITSQGQRWFFYLHLGWLMYATGGTHQVRRWQRNLAKVCPAILSNSSALKVELPAIEPGNFTTCWEENLLSLWVAQQKITREQAAEATQAILAEVLFELLQATSLTYQIKPDKSLSTQLILIDAEAVIAQIQPLVQAWKTARLNEYSPNKSPQIKQSEQLEKTVSPSVYQALAHLLNGQYTLHDLAVQMKRDIVQVTRPLLPYIQSGWVELISVADLPSPVKTSVTTSITRTTKEPLIACVDDSPLVGQTMVKLLTSYGYQSFSITDDLRAIAILLAKKPDLIFLDLVMPNTNGYEICTQLRKISVFRNTPIVILTGNDGIVDQVRARLVGASDFLSKPIEPETVLNVINKHLQHPLN